MSSTKNKTITIPKESTDNILRTIGDISAQLKSLSQLVSSYLDSSTNQSKQEPNQSKSQNSKQYQNPEFKPQQSFKGNDLFISKEIMKAETEIPCPYCFSAEFFPNIQYTIYFTNQDDPLLPEALKWIEETSVDRIAFNFQFSQNKESGTKDITIFQFASPNRALIVHYLPSYAKSIQNTERCKEILYNFLKTHSFISRGFTLNDFFFTTLSQMFNDNFESNMIDFDFVYLLQYKIPKELRAMISHYININITMIRWDFYHLGYYTRYPSLHQSLVIKFAYLVSAIIQSYQQAIVIHPNALAEYEIWKKENPDAFLPKPKDEHKGKRKTKPKDEPEEEETTEINLLI